MANDLTIGAYFFRNPVVIVALRADLPLMLRGQGVIEKVGGWNFCQHDPLVLLNTPSINFKKSV